MFRVPEACRVGGPCPEMGISNTTIDPSSPCKFVYLSYIFEAG
jgi:hypothetical protein